MGKYKEENNIEEMRKTATNFNITYIMEKLFLTPDLKGGCHFIKILLIGMNTKCCMVQI